MRTMPWINRIIFLVKPSTTKSTRTASKPKSKKITATTVMAPDIAALSLKLRIQKAMIPRLIWLTPSTI